MQPTPTGWGTRIGWVALGTSLKNNTNRQKNKWATKERNHRKGNWKNEIQEKNIKEYLAGY